MQIFVSCPPGVADLTAAELRNCGATQTREFKLGVQAEGSLEVAYRACLWSRTASRVLLPLGTFPAATQDQLYEGVRSIDWQQHIASERHACHRFRRLRRAASRTRISARSRPRTPSSISFASARASGRRCSWSSPTFASMCGSTATTRRSVWTFPATACIDAPIALAASPRR